MPRVLLIANPAAARTHHDAVATIMQTLRAAGWTGEVLATGGPGDARRLAEYGVAERVDVVAVFGGDGTTMQAAAALVGTDVALGVIPGGTGNLLAGNLRIPSLPARAAKALVSARPRPFDLGRMDRASGTQYFAVACGAGYDARVMSETLSEHKQRWGMAAYVATTLRLIGEVRSSTHVITIDGVEWDANAAMVLVANCGEVIPPTSGWAPGSAPTTVCWMWWSCEPTASARAYGRCGTCSGWPRLAGARMPSWGTRGAAKSGWRLPHGSRFSSTASRAGTRRLPPPWSRRPSASWCRLAAEAWRPCPE